MITAALITAYIAIAAGGIQVRERFVCWRGLEWRHRSTLLSQTTARGCGKGSTTGERGMSELHEMGLGDCGDNSCAFAPRPMKGMRTNGGCRCKKHLLYMRAYYIKERETDELEQQLEKMTVERVHFEAVAMTAIDENKELEAELTALREALEKLARLGNGDRYGNSEGNVIAQDALKVLQEKGE